MKNKLSVKHSMFVNSMLKGNTETQAAIDAKYSPRSAHVTACRLLKNAKIKEALDKGKEKAADKAGVTVEYVVGKLKGIADVCSAEVIKTDPVSNETLKVVVDANGANQSLKMLGQHLAMFTDKVEVGMSDALAERLARAEQRAMEK